MPRQAPDTQQKSLLACDMNMLIASLPGFKSIMRQAQSNNNPIASSNDNNQPFPLLIPLILLINFSNTSCVKHKRPPLGTQVTIVKVVGYWIMNSCDDTLGVMSPAYLKRKM